MVFDMIIIGKLNMTVHARRVKSNTKKQLSSDQEWNRSYQALLHFGRINHHYNVPQSSIYECELEGLAEDGGTFFYRGYLGGWVHAQRQSYKGKRTPLTSERKLLLQCLVDQGMFILHIVFDTYWPVLFDTLYFDILGKFHW